MKNKEKFLRFKEDKSDTTHSRYWNNITDIYERQREKGLKEYGHPLEEETDMNSIQRLTAIEEELVDALMYIEHAKEGMKE
jgi:hypothetical protein